MKHIQTALENEEFLRLKALCIIQGNSLKQTMREAILLYLNVNQDLFNKGELQNVKKENG